MAVVVMGTPARDSQGALWFKGKSAIPPPRRSVVFDCISWHILWHCFEFQMQFYGIFWVPVLVGQCMSMSQGQ